MKITKAMRGMFAPIVALSCGHIPAASKANHSWACFDQMVQGPLGKPIKIDCLICCDECYATAGGDLHAIAWNEVGAIDRAGAWRPSAIEGNA